jgi:hypothetical protein
MDHTTQNGQYKVGNSEGHKSTMRFQFSKNKVVLESTAENLPQGQFKLFRIDQ